MSFGGNIPSIGIIPGIDVDIAAIAILSLRSDISGIGISPSIDINIAAIAVLSLGGNLLSNQVAIGIDANISRSGNPDRIQVSGMHVIAIDRNRSTHATGGFGGDISRFDRPVTNRCQTDIAAIEGTEGDDVPSGNVVKRRHVDVASRAAIGLGADIAGGDGTGGGDTALQGDISPIAAGIGKSIQVAGGDAAVAAGSAEATSLSDIGVGEDIGGGNIARGVQGDVPRLSFFGNGS